LEKTNVANLYLAKLFTFISVTSYFVYIVHLELFSYAINHATNTSSHNMVMLLVVSLIATYAIASISYRYCQKPIIDLRDKNITKWPTKVAYSKKQSL
jgi:peptidoglycan/LPS O-acetylase OafA/YrhL